MNAFTLRDAAADYLMTQAPKRRAGFRLYQERRLADLEALMDMPDRRDNDAGASEGASEGADAHPAYGLSA